MGRGFVGFGCVDLLSVGNLFDSVPFRCDETSKGFVIMQGQWLGQANGSNNGLVLVDLDDAGDHFEGHAYLFDDSGMPGALAPIRTIDRSDKHRLKARVFPLHPNRPQIATVEEMRGEFQNVSFPSEADISIELKPRSLKVAWRTNVGTSGNASLPLNKVTKPSDYTPRRDVRTWKQFKEYAVSLSAGTHMFRGQDVPKRLRTTFHRSRRSDLIPFIQNDIPVAHRVLTARTQHLFDLNDSMQNGAFWNLIQHHGYPTPLLDWTHSPFVAAFFAYRFNRNLGGDPSKIRIFAFNRAAWIVDYPQLQHVGFSRPHFSILEALTIENKRALPQQALSSVTNIEDVESYIREREVESGHRYLEVVDLPQSERRTVMQELSLMGITAGSLFPGLDGACEELRGRFFSPLV